MKTNFIILTIMVLAFTLSACKHDTNQSKLPTTAQDIPAVTPPPKVAIPETEPISVAQGEVDKNISDANNNVNTVINETNKLKPIPQQVLTPAVKAQAELAQASTNSAQSEQLVIKLKSDLALAVNSRDDYADKLQQTLDAKIKAENADYAASQKLMVDKDKTIAKLQDTIIKITNATLIWSQRFLMILGIACLLAFPVYLALWLCPYTSAWVTLFAGGRGLALSCIVSFFGSTCLTLAKWLPTVELFDLWLVGGAGLIVAVYGAYCLWQHVPSGTVAKIEADVKAGLSAVESSVGSVIKSAENLVGIEKTTVTAASAPANSSTVVTAPVTVGTLPGAGEKN